MQRTRTLAGLVLVAGALTLAGCGGSSASSGSSSPGGSSTAAAGGKGGTFISLANASPGTMDPAINYTLQGWQLLITTHDGLVAFKRAAGIEGTKIVADLATAVPKPTDGGKTYTFTVRKGIKYSDGTPLKASDFRYVMERQFTAHGPVSSFYQGIVGGDACAAKPATCDLSKGIVADDKAGTVVFHLTKADPEFLDKMALPFAFAVPPSTPKTDVGNNVPPGTGSYMWKEYNPNREIKLVRNPFFKEWSKDAQPEGLPDEIVQKFGLTVEAEVTQVENGQADWVFDPPPADRLNEMGTKFASQVHVNPLTAVWYMALNTRIPPFNNLKARQAVNYATDRNALVKINGGPQLAVPTCQVLPPNFPGYKPYCPYTSGPQDGKWHGPDMTKAQQLMQESGTKGQKVAVVSTTDEVGKAIGQYFQQLLNKLGYNASLKLLGGGPQYEYIQDSSNHVQIGFSSWYQDYPAASDFLNVLLGCSNFHPNSNASPNISEFCDKKIQAEMDKALKLGVTDPDAANAIWAKVDQEVTNQAPWVAFFNPKLVDFVSKRVSGYQFSPQWYFLLDQASVAQ